MNPFFKFLTTLIGQPPETLALLLGLSAVVLAGYTIHTIRTISRRRDDER